MPLRSYISVRVLDPSEFEQDSFKTIELTDGILAIVGRKKGEKATTIQAYRFAKDKFTVKDVEEWLKEHGVIPLEFEVPKDEMILQKGSYEDTIDKLTRALGSVFADTDVEDYWIEATTNTQVLVGVVTASGVEYRLGDWRADDDGNVEIVKLVPVDVDVAITVKDEAKIEPRDAVLYDNIDVDIILDEARTTECRRGKVKKAQVANKMNANRRVYSEKVLREAVDRAKEHIAKFGAFHMDSCHRVVDGKNYRDVRETVALMDEIDFDGESVSIGFSLVDTQAGKDFQALIDAGAKFQVSQRGTGKSHVIKDSNGNLVEIVDALVIDGFDFLPAGMASVEEANVEFLEGKGEESMENKSLTREEIEEMLRKEREAIVSVLLQETKQESINNNQEGGNDTMLDEKIKEIEERLLVSQERLEEIRRKDLEFQAEKEKSRILSEQLADTKYVMFTESQKAVLASKIRHDDIIELVGTDAFREEIIKRLDEEVATAVKILADDELKKLGYSRGSSVSTGRTVFVANEAKPWMETVDRLYEDVVKAIRRRKPANAYYMPDDHPAMATLNRMCENFEQMHYRELLNEAGEEVTQSDIGVKVATISRVVIPATFRFITAFDVCDVGTMTNRIENVMYATWNAGYTAGAPHTSVGAIEIAEGGTIPVGGIQYNSCPILANRKTMKTKISPEAIATARGTSMNPVADSIASLAIDVSQRIDELLWYLMIAQASAYSDVQVTSYETLTKVGSTTEYQSAHEGWVQYEYVKAYDSNGNPTSAKLVPLFGSTSGNTKQAVVVAYGSTPTVLDYGTDYTINWPDGSVTLTSAGATKVGTNDVKAKYTYTTNIATWSIIPDSGVKMFDHLVGLRQAVGEARTKIGNRNYVPNVIGMSLRIEDLVTTSPVFTQAGSTPADLLDRLNKVVAYAGLDPVRTSALPDGFAVVMERGACVYRNHTPWNVSGPNKDLNTGDEVWIGEEFSGQDVPVKAKLALVGITDLNTAR